MTLSCLLRASSCRALAGVCSGAAALASTRVGVLGRRHYLAPSLLAALDAYGEQFGHVRVSQKFVVPDADGWPEEAHGLELGRSVQELRARNKRKELPRQDATRLEELGMVWIRPRWPWPRVRQALLVYKEVHGDLEVTRAFLVPSEAPWPEEAWGMRLGKSVNQIRASEHFVKDRPERRAELDALGFVWDGLERRWEEVHATLLAYKVVLGSLVLPLAFVVPSEAEAPWPEEAWGMKLGGRVNNIRSSQEMYVKDHPERRAELDALGFRWNSLAFFTAQEPNGSPMRRDLREGPPGAARGAGRDGLSIERRWLGEPAVSREHAPDTRDVENRGGCEL
jgi:hypothetical protein